LTNESQNKVERLRGAAHALRALHKTLIASVQLGYEKLYGRVENPAALLQLLLNDPLFSWLRPLSALITQVDESLDEPAAIDDAQLSELRSTIERWTSDQNDGAEFATNYLALLQSDPDLVLAHAALHKQLARLPTNTQPNRKDSSV
jgi:hypothetical protein